MKKITELTKEEATSILHNVIDHNDWVFSKISFEPNIEDGRVTFSGEPIVGICYLSGINNDGYVLHFNHPKVIHWFYKHGYDIDELLEERILIDEENDKYINYLERENEKIK